MWWHKEPQYIYVMVRKDLPIWDQIIQVGHACYEAGHLYHKSWSKDTHLILLQAEYEKELMSMSENMTKSGIHHTTFYEPDPAQEVSEDPMGLTAICSEPLRGDIKNFFKDCVMWVP